LRREAHDAVTTPRPLTLDSSSTEKLAALRDEQLLVERIRARDPLAFEMIFRRYYGAMRGLAESIVGSRSVAEDVVQDVFLAVWASRKRLNIRSSLEAYLKQASRNTALRHTTRPAARSESLDELVANRADRACAALIDTNPSPEAAMQARATAAELARIAENLPPRVSEVYRLSRVDGLSNRGIAERLGISVKTVELHITRALSAFRVGLAKWDGD
jgi:RNA polymerase sigma-19 factor, ECF subfamily